MIPTKDPVAILGAGIAGLTAAAELQLQGIPAIVLEGSSAVGGLSQSFRDEEGFTYDFGAHFITNRLAASLGIGSDCRTVTRYREVVLLDKKAYGYPFGLVRKPKFALGALQSRLTHIVKRNPANSARDVFVQRYGRELTDTVAVPLLEAWSGVPATELAPSVADKVATSVPMTMWLRAAGKLSHRAVAIGYCRELPESAAVWHVYPNEGMGSLVAKLVSQVQDSITLNSRVEAIIVDCERVRAIRVGGKEVSVRGVFTSAPVHVLPKLIEGSTTLNDLTQFRYRPMLFVNLKLEGRHVLPEVVTWTPGGQYPFFRVTEAPLSMPWLAPEGKTVITADIGCEVGDAIWKLSDEQVTELVVSGTEAIVPDVRQRLLGSRVMKTPLAYPVFMSRYEQRRQQLATGYPIAGLVPIGRNGEFDHLLMEDVYWRTRRSTSRFIASLGPDGLPVATARVEGKLHAA